VNDSIRDAANEMVVHADAAAQWHTFAARTRERWQRPAGSDTRHVRVGRWHLGQASRLLPAEPTPDIAVHVLGRAALADLAPRVAPLLARTNVIGLRPGERVWFWPDGADSGARYQSAGHRVLTAALLEASAQAASEVTRAAPPWIGGIDQAAPLAPDATPDTAARDAAAGTHPRLREWARCCFGPSLPAPTLGAHAVIALTDAGLWGRPRRQLALGAGPLHAGRRRPPGGGAPAARALGP
jgi:hypothetical protein